MNRWKLRALDCLYPNRCDCCGTRIAFDRLICAECEAELQTIPAEYAHWAEENRGTEIPWDAAVSAFMYTGAAKAGVLAMKDGARGFAQYAANRLAERLRVVLGDVVPDCVTWVPVTKKRRRLQGYAHAETLGKMTAEALHLPVRGGLLTEHAGALRQHQVSGAERAQYAARFFHTGQDLRGQCILLTDDVLTTGSTLRRCTGLLKECGAERVIIATATMVRKPEPRAEQNK